MARGRLSFQVLISTIDQQDYTLLERMNIQSDCVVVNQCDSDSVEVFDYKEHKIKWINMNDRGVGLSRNTALLNADADIVLWADDDMIFEDNYPDIIIKAFASNRKADMLCFNLRVFDENKYVEGICHNRNRRVSLLNCMRYGAPNIAARRSAVLEKNISFSLMFGGGAEFSCGEDSLFLIRCIQSGLRVRTVNAIIADVHNNNSTWFTGYNDKFFIDKGVFFYVAFPKMYWLLYLYYSIKFPRVLKTGNFFTVLKLFIIGRNRIRKHS